MLRLTFRGKKNLEVQRKVLSSLSYTYNLSPETKRSCVENFYRMKDKSGFLRSTTLVFAMRRTVHI